MYNFEYTGGAQYFEAAVRYFFQFHDPTVLNRQGNDRVIVNICRVIPCIINVFVYFQGTQYASVIYCYTDEQMEIAYRVRIELQVRCSDSK